MHLKCVATFCCSEAGFLQSPHPFRWILVSSIGLPFGRCGIEVSNWSSDPPPLLVFPCLAHWWCFLSGFRPCRSLSFYHKGVTVEVCSVHWPHVSTGQLSWGRSWPWSWFTTLELVGEGRLNHITKVFLHLYCEIKMHEYSVKTSVPFATFCTTTWLHFLVLGSNLKVSWMYF